METAINFWRNADIGKLAKHWKYKEKTPYDIMAVLPHVVESKGIWDVAAGDNRIVLTLSVIMPDMHMMSSDISPKVDGVKEWNIGNGVPIWMPNCVDTVLLLGVIQYMDDAALEFALLKLKGFKVVVKTPCPVQDIHVCKPSDEMGGTYESYYRSASTVMRMVCKNHNISHMGTVYPDHLESKYGSIQRMFVGEPCE